MQKRERFLPIHNDGNLAIVDGALAQGFPGQEGIGRVIFH
jgi:hypothetical protein